MTPLKCNSNMTLTKSLNHLNLVKAFNPNENVRNRERFSENKKVIKKEITDQISKESQEMNKRKKSHLRSQSNFLLKSLLQRNDFRAARHCASLIIPEVSSVKRQSHV